MMNRTTTEEPTTNMSLNEGDKLRSEALAASSDELPPGYYRSPRVVATFAAVGLNLMAVYFGFLASAAALGSILAEFGNGADAALFSTAFTTSQAISALLMGGITDRFGRRPFILGTDLLGLIGAIVACTSKNLGTLIGANVLIGLAGGQACSCVLFVGELMSNKHKFIGAVTVAFPSLLATGLGPYFGQKLALHGDWRWIYYIQLILFVIASGLAFVFYHPPSFVQLHGNKISKVEELKRFDWIGTLLLIASLSLFLLGISWGGTPGNAWDSGKILGLLISGAVATVSFVLYECFANIARPIVPMRFFRDLRGFCCIVAYNSTMGICYIALQIMYPLQVTRLFSSTLSTESISWMSSTSSLGSWFGIVTLGYFFHRIRHIRMQLLAGALCATAFMGAMSSVGRSDKNTAIAFSFLEGMVIGWGQDVTLLLVQYIISDEDLGAGFSIVSGLRQVFGSIVTAAFIALHTNKVPGEIRSHLVPALTKAGLEQSSITKIVQAAQSGHPEAIAQVPGMTPNLLQVANNALADSYAAAYAYVYYFAAALGVFLISAALFSQDFDQYLTSHVSRRIYKRGETAKDVLDSSNTSQNSLKGSEVDEKDMA